MQGPLPSGHGAGRIDRGSSNKAGRHFGAFLDRLEHLRQKPPKIGYIAAYFVHYFVYRLHRSFLFMSSIMRIVWLI
jgi:hypothetical protein